MKKPTLDVPTTKQMERMAEMEQMVAEQDTSLSSLTHKLKVLSAELERQRHVAASQAKQQEAQTTKWVWLQLCHTQISGLLWKVLSEPTHIYNNTYKTDEQTAVCFQKMYSCPNMYDINVIFLQNRKQLFSSSCFSAWWSSYWSFSTAVNSLAWRWRIFVRLEIYSWNFIAC